MHFHAAFIPSLQRVTHTGCWTCDFVARSLLRSSAHRSAPVHPKRPWKRISKAWLVVVTLVCFFTMFIRVCGGAVVVVAEILSTLSASAPENSNVWVCILAKKRIPCGIAGQSSLAAASEGVTISWLRCRLLIACPDQYAWRSDGFGLHHLRRCTRGRASQRACCRRSWALTS